MTGPQIFLGSQVFPPGIGDHVIFIHLRAVQSKRLQKDGFKVGEVPFERVS